MSFINSMAVILSALIALTLPLGAQTISRKEPIGKIGERAIYEDDLLPWIGAQLVELKNQEYELKARALQNLINQRLLEEEAKGTGLSLQQFLSEKVDRNVAPPLPAEVEAYYVAHKDPLGRPLEEIKGQLEKIVGQLTLQKARREYFEPLQRKAGVSILLSRPRADVVPDPLRARGTADAPVTIIEFADFECPYCQQAEEVMNQVRHKYPDKVRFAFLDFPLKPIHPLASHAAEASRCAAEQGKFWEYHDLLFAQEAKLDAAGLRDNARTVGLNLDRFGACLDSGKFAPAVDRDILTGYRAGVSSTPTFYINGIALVGIQKAAALEKIIDAELAAAESSH